MRKIILSSLFALCLSPVLASAGVHEDHPYHFSINKEVSKTAETYVIKARQSDTYPGNVKKSSFRIRTNYDLSNKQGWQATGITRILSLGSVYSWATDIDIYDTRGVKIAMIDGDLATLESAKFNLYEYDDEGNETLVGVAFADDDFKRFTIHPTSSDPNTLAELTRNHAGKTWDVHVENPEKLDDRLVRIFAGFVVDFQDKFLADKRHHG